MPRAGLTVAVARAGCGQVRRGAQWRPSTPLYERAPTRDENGVRVSDFMMLIPGLRDRPEGQFAQVLRELDRALALFREIVFIDLNVPLNLLWVSVKPRPGVILEIACAIQQFVPEALVVAPRLVDHRGEI